MYAKKLDAGKYQLTLSVGTNPRKRFYKTVTARNKTELSREIKLFEQEYASGELTANKCKLTLYQVCSKVLDEHLSVGIKPLSLVAYESSLKRIRKFSVADKPYTEVTNGDIQLLVNALDKQYSLATVKLTYTFLKTALEAFEAIDGIPSPIRKVKIRGKAEEQEKSLSKEEFVRLCRALGSSNIELVDKVCVELALFCGLRRGEALALKWEHIDGLCINVSENRVNVHGEWITQSPKTKSSIRTVAMTESLKEDLEELHQQYLDNGYISPYILLGKFGQPFTALDVNKAVDSCFGEAELEFKSYHKLRHTYASFLVWLKTDVNVASSQLGHSSPKMTLGVYTHNFESARAASLKVAGDLDLYLREIND